MTEPLKKTAREKSRRSESIRAVVNNLIVRRSAGETVADESVIEQHPDLMPELADELRNLRIAECAEQDAQAANEGLRIGCPHCHNPVELVDDASLSEVLCPSCGSQFSLVDDSDRTFQASSKQTIGHFQLLEKVGMGAFGSVWRRTRCNTPRSKAVEYHARHGWRTAPDGLWLGQTRIG